MQKGVENQIHMSFFLFLKTTYFMKFYFLQKNYACTHAYEFWYIYSTPRRIELHTEYYLYDFISMLGNVGGSLGLFVGFSFSGAIGYLLNIILKIYQKWNSSFQQKDENETPSTTFASENATQFLRENVDSTQRIQTKNSLPDTEKNEKFTPNEKNISSNQLFKK